MKISTPDIQINFSYVNQPSTRALKIFGFYCGQEKSSCSKYALLFWTVIVKLIVVFNVVRYVFVFIGSSGLDASVVSSLALFTFFLYVAFVSLTLTFSLPGHIWKLEELFNSYIEANGPVQYLRRVRIRIRIFVILTSVLGSCFSVIYSVTVNLTLSSVRRHLVPCDNLTGYGDIACQTFYTFMILCLFSQLISAAAVLNMTTIPLLIEFRNLSKTLKDDSDLTDAKLDKVLSRHSHLCRITSEANSINKHFVSATYVFGIPNICFLSYGVVRGSLPWDELLFCSGNLLINVLLMVYVTILSCYLNDQAHEPLRILLDSEWSVYSETVVQKMVLFGTKLASEKVGYSCYGIFTVDRAAILMIFGTIMTYVVVILQFQS